ncbi:MAG TPA: dual specificity protein phosphatase [Ktedonobacteraceae bacterium]|nr:dual specificity protein phosphatase [Ktedonobacteraceae bacterium]
MSSDPMATPSSSNPSTPSPETATPEVKVVEPTGELVTVRESTGGAAAPTRQVQFSGSRWFFGGIVRLLYRSWTRVAVRLFPENSEAEHIARSLHIPLPDQLNMSWITDHLAVGGRIHPKDIPSLELLGITAVVDTRSEYRDEAELMEQAHIQLLLLPAPDTYPLTVEQLFTGSRWVQEHMQHGGRVLIHCEHGVGRSVLLTTAVLVYGGMSAHEALQLVQKKRWQASPNHRQVARLREFEAAVAAQRDNT